MTRDITCRHVVELVTEFLEGALAPSERLRLEQHLLLCEGCASYLEQMRLTIRLARALSEGEAPLRGRDELLASLREPRRGST